MIDPNKGAVETTLGLQLAVERERAQSIVSQSASPDTERLHIG